MARMKTFTIDKARSEACVELEKAVRGSRSHSRQQSERIGTVSSERWRVMCNGVMGNGRGTQILSAAECGKLLSIVPSSAALVNTHRWNK